MKKILLTLVLLATCFAGSTAAIAGNYGGAEPPEPHDFKVAITSFYGPGSFTLASGKKVRSERDLFVAHKRLPFGTKVLFRNGKKEVIVKVLDRGPYVSGRDWDLSYAAAKKLGILSEGATRVRYDVLK